MSAQVVKTFDEFCICSLGVVACRQLLCASGTVVKMRDVGLLLLCLLTGCSKSLAWCRYDIQGVKVEGPGML